ncbi:hypothetical protein BGZ65_002356 [Modicella reniformis]|uniref:GST N-terminal domain-containing protein n=1 Tax=Modicella reniformis TaxID=1440133 RepID=A0A9P6IL42_9FUNG|nr:hypothetical protein BGZ65_002356 [Modicella reniformis]
MSSANTRTFEEKDRAALIGNIEKQNSSFKLKYFKLHGMAWTVHLILATTGAKWECISPQEWAAEKNSTLFGVLPVLYETTSSGQAIEIPESEAIEYYLARKFCLYGTDVFDEIKTRSFSSSINAIINYYLYRVAVVKDETYKAVMLGRFLSEALPPFVATHERHLEANGRNGHYVGNKLSLADIKLLIAVDIILALTGDEHVSKEKTPAIWTAYEIVNDIPSLIEWRNTESYKEVAEGNKRNLGI